MYSTRQLGRYEALLAFQTNWADQAVESHSSQLQAGEESPVLPDELVRTYTYGGLTALATRGLRVAVYGKNDVRLETEVEFPERGHSELLIPNTTNVLDSALALREMTRAA